MKTKAEYEATKTTMESVTRQQVQALRREAGEAGDSEQVWLCDVALRYLGGQIRVSDGDGQAALRKCVAAINDAEAQ